MIKTTLVILTFIIGETISTIHSNNNNNNKIIPFVTKNNNKNKFYFTNGCIKNSLLDKITNYNSSLTNRNFKEYLYKYL